MNAQFGFDVFLSHSSRDKRVVRDVAERLRADGLRVWFDEWEIRPGDSIQRKVEEGLQSSRVLVLCMSANAFGSEWAQLEAGTFRFRAPLNKDLSFVPLRIDDAPIEGSLAQFKYIDWRPRARPSAYPNLLNACSSVRGPARDIPEQIAEKALQLDIDVQTFVYAFSLGAKQVLTGNYDATLRIWNLRTGRCVRTFRGHTGEVWSVQWSGNRRRILSGSDDTTIRLWDASSGRCLRVLKGHTGCVYDLAWSADQRRALSCSEDKTLRLWDVETGTCLKVLDGHRDEVYSVLWTKDQQLGFSSSEDTTIRGWDLKTGQCSLVLDGHKCATYSLALAQNGRSLISGADDGMRLWDLRTGRCIKRLDGHTSSVLIHHYSPDQRLLLSGSCDKSARVWELETGRCLRVLKGHTAWVRAVVWSANGRHAWSGDEKGNIRFWDLSILVKPEPSGARARTLLRKHKPPH
jgi:WD40 repeat protein